MGIKKAVKKAKSTLNKAGIRQLADDLVANKKMYDQDNFGSKSDCGTFACLAGFCQLRKVGLRAFNRSLKEGVFDQSECAVSGLEQLGLRVRKNHSYFSSLSVHIPEIFQSIHHWPDDLYSEYYENGPRGRVIVALKALQRLLPNGAIDADPKAVHTRLPQLKALVATAKKKA